MKPAIGIQPVLALGPTHVVLRYPFGMRDKNTTMLSPTE